MANRTFALAVLALSFFQVALASLYVINPSAQSTCHGGQPCTIDWLDDGQVPLLSTMGPCSVGLYTGNMQLVQQIDPIDVSTSLTLTFTPNPKAGSDSHDYYVAFTSTTAKNGSDIFRAFSPTFSIDEMSGSFSSPVASLTSAKPVPSSVANDSPKPISTVTISNKASAASSSAPISSTVSTPPSASSSSQSSGFTKASTSANAQSTASSPASSNVPTNGASFLGRGPSAFNFASSVPFLLCIFLSYPSGHP